MASDVHVAAACCDTLPNSAADNNMLPEPCPLTLDGKKNSCLDYRLAVVKIDKSAIDL